MTSVENLYNLGPAQIVGVAGSLTYLFLFAAVQLGRLDGNSVPYSLGNVCAAVMVGISLTVDFNLASAVIQGSWIVIGCAGLVLRLTRPVSIDSYPVVSQQGLQAPTEVYNDAR